jgi:hypothetical protein
MPFPGMPFPLRRDPGGDAARVNSVTTWLVSRTPNAVVYEVPLDTPGNRFDPLHFGAGEVGFNTETMLGSHYTTMGLGVVLGTVFGVALAPKGRRARGAGVGALLGGLAGIGAAVVVAQTALLTARQVRVLGTLKPAM